ncbi:Uncharacterised protein [uncultured archaeon]|nr:Uncharacterised protein [uncultured archaeon]
MFELLQVHTTCKQFFLSPRIISAEMMIIIQTPKLRLMARDEKQRVIGGHKNSALKPILITQKSTLSWKSARERLRGKMSQKRCSIFGFTHTFSFDFSFELFAFSLAALNHNNIFFSGLNNWRFWLWIQSSTGWFLLFARSCHVLLSKIFNTFLHITI